MNTFKKIITLSLSLVLFASCVDKEYDEPPINGANPDIAVTHTLQEIKTFFAGTGTVTALPADAVISGVVVSDDTQGNFYKDLVIEDATAGLLIRLDRSPLSPLMPRGRRLFIKCGGLYISDYNGLVQIGVKDVSGVARIPETLIDTYVLRGEWNQPIDPLVATDFNSLNPVTDQNKLVRLDNVHFLTDDVCQTWANVAMQTSENRTLIDANGNEMLVRTSNFATFAGSKVPGGTGSVVGILQVFGSDLQLMFRDLNDIQNFPPTNCTVNTTPVHTIADLKASYTGVAGTIPAGSDIEGIVITDKTQLNITGNNLVIQDATAGITVRFTVPNTFSLGDKVHIDLSGQELSEFNGLLQVNNVDIANATLTGTGTITPRVATIADINNSVNGEAWESTLVQISGVTISGSGTYSGSTTLTDPTGTLTMFTRSQALFAGTAYPATTVSVTGIVSDFNGRQLNIRNTSDVQ